MVAPRVQSTPLAVCARGGRQRVRVAGSATPPCRMRRACVWCAQSSAGCGLDPGGDHRVYDDEVPAASAKLASAHARSVRDRVRVATAYQWATGKAAGGALGGDGSVPIPRPVGLHQPVRHLRPVADFGHTVCGWAGPEPALCSLAEPARAGNRQVHGARFVPDSGGVLMRGASRPPCRSCTSW